MLLVERKFLLEIPLHMRIYKCLDSFDGVAFSRIMIHKSIEKLIG